MIRICLPILLLALAGNAFAFTLQSETATYELDDRTGALTSVIRRLDGKPALARMSNSYYLLSAQGDLKGCDSQDAALERQAGENWVKYVCENPDMPGLRIHKQYAIVNGGLRRTQVFQNNSAHIRFLQPFSSSHFAEDFLKDGYYFGAGYLGPFLPAAKVSSPTKVESYVQSSKGMLLANTRTGLGSFAHFRVKINDSVVFPWWQSTIGSYREKNDRLHYLPDGWRLALGTLDLLPGGSISYTDQIVLFSGGLHEFFKDILAHDPDFQRELATLPPAPSVLDNALCVIGWGFDPYLKYLTEMTEEGAVVCKNYLSADWADYRWQNGFHSKTGGFITGPEIQSYIARLHSISPRVQAGCYSITVGGDPNSPLYQEHPDWFRRQNRAGEEDILFPGMFTNYQTMMNRTEVREFISQTCASMADYIGAAYVYMDEAQHQNTINWQTMELIRDDHVADFWKRLRHKAERSGKFLFFNGSGNPYADLNYMECPRKLLQPDPWRVFAGVALGLELFSTLRPSSRLCLLYWRDFKDYIGRCLALGWIPSPLDIETGASIPYLRAIQETGKTLPVSIHHAPDWTRNPETVVESYAVRRKDADDMLLSYINRAPHAADLTVEVELDSLDLNGDINVWALKTIYPTKSDNHALSDAEIRATYQASNWFDQFVSVPRLIYSGTPQGKLSHAFKEVSSNHLVQLMVTPGHLSVFSIEGIPANYFYTSRRGLRITGREIRCERETAELLLATTRPVTDIRVDGVKADSRPIALGNVMGQIIRIGRGRHTLDWREASEATPMADRRSFASDGRIIHAMPENGGFCSVDWHGRSCCTGRTPLQLPERYRRATYLVRDANVLEGNELQLTLGRNSVIRYQPYPKRPAHVELKETRVQAKGLSVTRTGTFLGANRELRSLQPELPPCQVEADAERLRLLAGTTRREDTLDTSHYAGLEITGAQCLRLRLTNTFHNATSLFGDHLHVWGRRPELDFSGLVLDFRVSGNYAWRVALPVGIGSRELKNAFPSWGRGQSQDRIMSLGNLLDTPETVFSLDLERLAPKGWDGTLFLSIGSNHVMANRMLELEILSANDRSADDFLEPADLAAVSSASGKIPAPLALPRTNASPTSATPEWARLDNLQPYADSAPPSQSTNARLAYDSACLYVEVTAEESRHPVTRNANPWENDCIELWFATPKGMLLQMVIDAAGRTAFLPEEAGFGNGVSVKTIQSEQGSRHFLAIPWKNLEVAEPVPGTSIRFNLCRTRQVVPRERASWGPCRRQYGFRDLEKYGLLALGRLEGGLGRYEEITLP